MTNARVAVVDPAMCVGCLTCVRICPYGVPQVQSNLTGVGNMTGAAYIEPAVCHGCGTCVSECPARAIQLMHYKDAQTLNKIDALFFKDMTTPAFVPPLRTAFTSSAAFSARNRASLASVTNW